MAAKNRQGCCCGGKRTCLNVCTICGDKALKNGVITDDLGDHSFNQPTGDPTFLPWLTNWIELETEDWEDGNCLRNTGKTYYRYRIQCINTVEHPNSVLLSVAYSISNCPESVILFNADKPPGSTDFGLNTQSVYIDSEDITCDPISASATFTPPSGLSPPWLNPSFTFEIDEAATTLCACRNCAGTEYSDSIGIFPDGDVIVTYDIKEGIDEPRSGTVRLSKVPLIDPPSDSYLYKWVGNLEWWNEASCSNPTAAPGGFNIELTCSSFQFLQWGGDDCGSGFYVIQNNRDSVSIDNIRFNLVDSIGEIQGTLSVKDAPDAVLKGICCWPCDLPKVDFSFSYAPERIVIFQNPAQPPFQPLQQWDVDLTYSSDIWEIPTSDIDPTPVPMGHWKGGPITISDGFNPDLHFMIYFDCGGLGDFGESGSGLLVVMSLVQDGFPDGTYDFSTPVWTGIAISDASCSPVHVHWDTGWEIAAGPQGVVNNRLQMYLDEKE